MAKDIIHEDEFYEEVERPAKPVKSVKPTGGGGGTTLKDYVIVALIAIVAVMGINNYVSARGNGGALSSGCGGCGSGGGAAAAKLSTEELRLQALEYYVTTYNDADVEAEVQDFGCHQEIYIYKNGELIKRIGYGSGQMYEIS